MTDPVEVLEFWFADTLTNPDSLAGRWAIWFMGGPDIDQLITEKFGTLPDAALAGELLAISLPTIGQRRLSGPSTMGQRGRARTCTAHFRISPKRRLTAAIVVERCGR